MRKTILRCPKCNRIISKDTHYPIEPYIPLCDRCKERVKSKLDEVDNFSYDTKKEICEKHGVGDAKQAYIYKRWGKPPVESYYSCDSCGCSLGSSPSNQYTDYTRHFAHRCSSCQSKYERMLKDNEEERKREKKRMRRMGL